MQLDKAKGRATGTLGKGELGDALKAFFRVGQPGGKTEERHDELMQVCSSTSLPSPPPSPAPPPSSPSCYTSFGQSSYRHAGPTQIYHIFNALAIFCYQLV